MATKLTEVKSPPRNEQLHINYNKKEVKGTLLAFKFIDKDTKQHVVFLPSLDVSAYGETNDKAESMLKESIEYCFEYLLSLPVDDLRIQLSRYGWKKQMFNKDFSKAYVDENGLLQNLNAEGNKIERVTLTAA